MMKDRIKVLFATDFLPSSKLALETLLQLKEKTTVDLTLIHVISSFWKNWISSGLYEKEASQRLLTWQKKILNKNDPGTLIIDKGHPAETIIKAGKKLKVDMILLGGGDAEYKGSKLTGSVSASVVRMAEQSVWLCKKEKINHILCGIDCSTMSAEALKEAIDLSRRFKASLTVASVIPLLNFNPLGMEEDEIKKIESKYKNQKSKEIEKFLKQFDFSGIETEKHFPWGSPSHVILNMSEDFNIDLIVIGATGHGQLSRALMGSTAEKILSHAPCSLLIVR